MAVAVEEIVLTGEDEQRIDSIFKLWEVHREAGRDVSSGAENRHKNHQVYLSYVRHIEGFEVDKDRRTEIKRFKGPDFQTFWNEVVRIRPNDYTLADLDFLVEKCSDKNSAYEAVLKVGYGGAWVPYDK